MCLFAFSQFDLLKEAFRIYCLGYDYDKVHEIWKYDQYKLLRQAIRWHNAPSERIKNEEKPVLFPFERLSSAIKPELIKKHGIIDTQNMTGYRENSSGDFILPSSMPESAFNGNREEWIESLASSGDTRHWEEYHEGAMYGGIDLAFVNRTMKDLALEAIASKEK